MPDHIIRTATTADVDAIAKLMVAHALYEKSIIQEEGLATSFERHLSRPDSQLNCLVVEYEGQLVGYTTFIKQFSTWDADFYIYLDCLYLDDSMRCHGIGQELMEYIKEYAKAEGCKEIQWQTPDFNTGAIKFYKRLGALAKTKERFFWEV
ncbi:MAG: GNAT family N-acetyltransferase [Roseivirga sp.]|nr:GNAT family N-acetyltransferase [Roseivirga sp.]